MINLFKSKLKKNNEEKESFEKKLASVAYRINKGRINAGLVGKIDDIKESYATLVSDFQSSCGTGEEDLGKVVPSATKALKDFDRALSQDLVTRVETAFGNLKEAVEFWGDVLSGDVPEEGLSDEENVSKAKKKVLEKVEQFDTIISRFDINITGLDKDLTAQRKELEELKDKIVEEEDDLVAEELGIKIESAEQSINASSVYKQLYISCKELLNMIRRQVQEIIRCSSISPDDIYKANAYLKMKDLMNVIDHPEKAQAILKSVLKNISEISARATKIRSDISKNMPNPIGSTSTGASVKERVLREREEKAKRAAMKAELNSGIETNKMEETRVEGEDK